MKKFIAVLALVASTGFVLAGGTGSQASPRITVTGQGKVVFVPDLGYIQVGVSSEGWTAAEAWKKNEGVVKKIFAELKKLGVQEKDFKTSNLSVQLRYLHKQNEQPKFLGYTVTYDLSVTVRKLDQMGALLDAMIDAGANRNMNVSFGHSKLEEMLDQARVKSVAEARKKANLYVTGAGARLGEVLSISDMPYNHPIHNYPVDAPGGLRKARPACRSPPASNRCRSR